MFAYAKKGAIFIYCRVCDDCYYRIDTEVFDRAKPLHNPEGLQQQLPCDICGKVRTLEQGWATMATFYPGLCPDKPRVGDIT